MVRYVSPSFSNLPESLAGSTPVHFIVFPKYREGAVTTLAPLDKIEVLQRLASTGSSLRTLTGQDVAAMISLVERCSSYELVYADIAEAVSLLEEHVFTGSP
jgi:iron-sulfur cluster repair protein YtfE (RIC family)